MIAVAAASVAVALGGGGASATADVPTEIEVAASGDLLPHSPVYNRALANGGGRRYDFRPMFRSIRPRLRRADLALCHVETVLAPGRPHGYPRFRTPPALAEGIRAAGWDACSTASNHSSDYGMIGIRRTVGTLRRAGVGSAGTYRSRRARAKGLSCSVRAGGRSPSSPTRSTPTASCRRGRGR